MKQLGKIIAFDLDDVICTRPKGYEHLGAGKYYECQPVPEMVKIVNETYEAGYIVKIYTARGMSVFNGDVTKIYSNLYSILQPLVATFRVLVSCNHSCLYRRVGIHKLQLYQAM